MSQPTSGQPDVGRPRDPDAIQAEIEATREQLGRTVDQLAVRLDVPARVREQVAEKVLVARDVAVETYRESPPAVLGAAALLVAVVGVVVWRRKR
jgi:uncharacterized protein DUF3618